MCEQKHHAPKPQIVTVAFEASGKTGWSSIFHSTIAQPTGRGAGAKMNCFRRDMMRYMTGQMIRQSGIGFVPGFVPGF